MTTKALVIIHLFQLPDENKIDKQYFIINLE